ncbi:KIR protein [Plasmodium coatneyi]|uniref:KIR protein n=1 Tax=Plasmodium coatneyi TaxID=208452 RepID=A0A1B1E0W0_9APIC|nr:KIR protein [Plasmodium coatneyi]ANQ08673.1 KIR protein [Plasmodium coatneyi]
MASEPTSLPSEVLFYGPFRRSTWTDSKECVEGIKNALETNASAESYFNQVNKAVCYVSSMYEHQKNTYSNKEPCHFLYYWIGDVLFSILEENNIKTLLQTICRSIQEKCWNGNFEIPCNPIGKEFFDHMKITYDFLYDYSNIKEYLQHYNTNHNMNFTNYLEKVKEAKNYMSGGCNNQSGYCNNFWNPRKADIEQKLSNLESEINSAQDVKSRAEAAKQSTQLKLDEAILQANKASSLSSAFGTLAALELPAALFLLYKTLSPNNPPTTIIT